MFSKYDELEINAKTALLNEILADMDKTVQTKVLSLIRYKKIPTVRDPDLIKFYLDKIENKTYAGVKPSVVRGYYIDRILNNKFDVLGQLISGELDDLLAHHTQKKCYILTSAKDSLPPEPLKSSANYIWVPPAKFVESDAVTIKKLGKSTETNEIQSELLEADIKRKKEELTECINITFNIYLNTLNEFYIILPNAFFGNKYIRNLRESILAKAIFCVYLKYGANFNAVLIKISNNFKHIKNGIPCYFHTSEEKKIRSYNQANLNEQQITTSRDLFVKFFNELAIKLSSNYYLKNDSEWILEPNKQKSVVSMKIEPDRKIIGKFIYIRNYFKPIKEDVLPESIKDRCALIGGRYYVGKFPTYLTDKEKSDLDLNMVNPKFNIKKWDIFLKTKGSLENGPVEARAPEKGTEIFLMKNNDFYIRIKEELLKDEAENIKLSQNIIYSINEFAKKHIIDISAIGILNFKLINAIPYIEKP